MKNEVHILKTISMTNVRYRLAISNIKVRNSIQNQAFSSVWKSPGSVLLSIAKFD